MQQTIFYGGNKCARITSYVLAQQWCRNVTSTIALWLVIQRYVRMLVVVSLQIHCKVGSHKSLSHLNWFNNTILLCTKKLVRSGLYSVITSYISPRVDNWAETVYSTTSYLLEWIASTVNWQVPTAGDLFPLVALMGFSPKRCPNLTVDISSLEVGITQGPLLGFLWWVLLVSVYLESFS